MLAHLELVVGLDMARFQLAKHDGKRHELAHARRRHQRIRILLVKDEIGVDINKDGMFGLGFESSWSLGGGMCEPGQTSPCRDKHSECHGELDQVIKAQSVHVSTRRIGRAPAAPVASGPNY